VKSGLPVDRIFTYLAESADRLVAKPGGRAQNHPRVGACSGAQVIEKKTTTHHHPRRPGTKKDKD